MSHSLSDTAGRIQMLPQRVAHAMRPEAETGACALNNKHPVPQCSSFHQPIALSDTARCPVHVMPCHTVPPGFTWSIYLVNKKVGKWSGMGGELRKRPRLVRGMACSGSRCHCLLAVALDAESVVADLWANSVKAT